PNPAYHREQGILERKPCISVILFSIPSGSFLNPMVTSPWKHQLWRISKPFQENTGRRGISCFSKFSITALIIRRKKKLPPQNLKKSWRVKVTGSLRSELCATT